MDSHRIFRKPTRPHEEDEADGITVPVVVAVEVARGLVATIVATMAEASVKRVVNARKIGSENVERGGLDEIQPAPPCSFDLSGP